MPKPLKIILIVLVSLIMLGSGCYYCGKFAFEKMETGIQETKEKVEADVKTWNKKSRTQSETLAEAIRRGRTCDSDFDIPCIIEQKSFLILSLKFAKPSPNFCKDVPSTEEIMKSVSWRLNQCNKIASDIPGICEKLIAEVQTVCERKNEK